MGSLRTDDGVALYYEEAGSGTPIVFVHEFAGDHRSWEPQLRYFSRGFRCIAYNARGYPPSAVPADISCYSQERAREDLRCVLDELGINRAHIVGCSMGAMAALHYGMVYATRRDTARALSLTLVGCGSGAHPALYRSFQSDSRQWAARIRAEGMKGLAASYGHGPARLQYRTKDPRGFAQYLEQLGNHCAEGSALTLEGYIAARPSLYALTPAIAAIDVPTLVITGDEDELCLEPSLLIKRLVRQAGLLVVPRTGHAVNLEEPELFNRSLDVFLHQLAQGAWHPRSEAEGALALSGAVFGPGGPPA